MSETRTALVTGAASGIGLAGMRRLAGQGVTVVAVDRDERVVVEAAQAGAEAIVVDLADADAVVGLAAEALRRHGRVDILVNNAGISPHRDGERVPTSGISTADWHAVMGVNLTAPFLLCRDLIEPMRTAGWGRIVNISSRAARAFTRTAGAHYAASKSAVVGFSRVLAGDYGRYGVTVNCIAPGRIQTPLSEQGPAELLASLYDEIPVGRAGTPAEVAAMIAYLASDEAGFVNGAILDINGGGFMP